MYIIDDSNGGLFVRGYGLSIGYRPPPQDAVNLLKPDGMVFTNVKNLKGILF